LQVAWAATSPNSGRLAPEVESTFDELLARFRELRARGEGYLEVRNPDRDFPAITMGFRDGRAVIHVAHGPESLALLRGDDSVSPNEQVEVLIIDEPAVFTGEVAMRLDHAWQLVEYFARTGSVDEHENWFET
jgi:hypothetical protein